MPTFHFLLAVDVEAESEDVAKEYLREVLVTPFVQAYNCEVLVDLREQSLN